MDIEKFDAEMSKKEKTFENKSQNKFAQPIKVEETTTEPHLQVQNPTEINQNDKLPVCNIQQPAGESIFSVNSALSLKNIMLSPIN